MRGDLRLRSFYPAPNPIGDPPVIRPFGIGYVMRGISNRVFSGDLIWLET